MSLNAVQYRPQIIAPKTQRQSHAPYQSYIQPSSNQLIQTQQISTASSVPQWLNTLQRSSAFNFTSSPSTPPPEDPTKKVEEPMPETAEESQIKLKKGELNSIDVPVITETPPEDITTTHDEAAVDPPTRLRRIDETFDHLNDDNQTTYDEETLASGLYRNYPGTLGETEEQEEQNHARIAQLPLG